MPQNKNLTEAWKSALGLEWDRIHGEWLHTLGNLTLTGYNSEYSDRPFVDKRDMKGGFKDSPLKVNAGLGSVDSWNEETIKKRALELSCQAPSVWPAPELPPDILAEYQNKTVPSSTYSVDDHPHLENPTVNTFFTALRKEVLALDSCVSEEFMKLYVAYKAESNFVDVVPQAKGLRLSLNMKFGDINDPRGLCQDVTHIGRWGNGDVEVRFSSLNELPYIIGLIRQSLEQQLGNGVDL